MSGSPHTHPLTAIISLLLRFPFGSSQLLSRRMLRSHPQTHHPQRNHFCTLQNWVFLAWGRLPSMRNSSGRKESAYGCTVGVSLGAAKSCVGTTQQERKPAKKKKQHPKNTPPKQPFPFYFLTLMARRLGNGSGVFFTSFQIFPGLH